MSITHDPVYLAGLNPEQRTAVLTTEGPVMVVAGAGSGKTKVIVSRIAHIISSKLARPHEILAVTFTNKAAKEMQERVHSMLGEELHGMWVCTFHSFATRVLRREIDHIKPYTSSFSIYDRDDQIALIRRLLKTGLSSTHEVDDSNLPPPGFFINKISLAKNRNQSPEDYQGYTPAEKLVAEIYPRYKKALLDLNALDFDDLLLETVHLFHDHPEVRTHYAERFRYILVDEYQDTNQPQFNLLRYLESVHGNICVVGDPDQSIYRFRGAESANISSFIASHKNPPVQVLPLSQNYRSTQPILDAANALIAPNQMAGVEKVLWTERTGGEKPRLILASDEQTEAAFVAEVVNRSHDSGLNAGRIAILYRTHSQSRALEEAMRRTGMNYTIVGGLRFYERKEVKDSLAYLRVINNSRDWISLERVIGAPPRGIGTSSLEKIRELAEKSNLDATDVLLHTATIPRMSTKGRESLAKLGDLILKVREKTAVCTAGEVAREILLSSGYLSWLEEQPDEGKERAENVWELIAAAEEQPQSLQDFLSTIALVTDVDRWEDSSRTVSMMTLHTAKGLEFDMVILVGLEEGVLPHAQSMDSEEQLAEERRLLYVGMTRARKILVMTCAGRRAFQGMWSQSIPSRFLNDIRADRMSVTELENNRYGYDNRSYYQTRSYDRRRY